MMFIPTLVAFAAAVFVQLASGHFEIVYPEWRADSIDPGNDNISQWNYPCAGIGDDAGNRTDWPLTGGAVALKLRHPWTYIYINLGLSIQGANVTNFNMSLTPDLTNVTGKGNFCLPHLDVPMDIAEGTHASIQIVTNGQDGQDMYNCADITFRANAKVPDGVCKNDTQISAVIVGQSTADSNQSATATVTVTGQAAGSTSTSQSSSANGIAEAYTMTLAIVLGLTFVATSGMGF
ncbi:hypothetical protein F4820DRAFT_365932 [Hypoxylon rubiginosum]|uniref:Uncharacterized protein n=1 Tax=Hypoxylon rubiginosum TaxID=110542 RepID=A0ACB9ZDD6_9PEZI|nr:hypothetical protein F4820DRAFT_365932 [Hypoxylon rubiginosum]